MVTAATTAPRKRTATPKKAAPVDDAKSASPTGKISKVSSRSSISSASADDKPARQHITSKIGIYMSQTRCEKAIKGVINDENDVERHKALKASFADMFKDKADQRQQVKDLHKEVSKLEKKLADIEAKLETGEATVAEKNAQKKLIDSKLKSVLVSPELKKGYETYAEQKEVSKRIIRLAKNVPIATSVLGDYIVREVINFAVEHVAFKTKLKTVDLKHIFTEGHDSMKVYPIIRTLKSWEKYVRNPELLQKASKKKTKKADGETVEEDVEAEEVADEEPVVDESAPSSNGDPTKPINFIRYIGKLIKHDIKPRIKADPRFAERSTIRVSCHVASFLSDLLVDLLELVSLKSKIMMHRIASVSTFNSAHLVDIVKMLVVYHDRDFANFAEIEKTIEDKLVEYDEQMKEQQKSRVDKKSATPAP